MDDAKPQIVINSRVLTQIGTYTPGNNNIHKLAEILQTENEMLMRKISIIL